MSIAILSETALSVTKQEIVGNAIAENYDDGAAGYDWMNDEEYLYEQNEYIDEVDDLLFQEMVMRLEGYEWEEELFKARPELRYYDYRRECEKALTEGYLYENEHGSRSVVSRPTWMDIEFVDEPHRKRFTHMYYLMALTQFDRQLEGFCYCIAAWPRIYDMAQRIIDFRGYRIRDCWKTDYTGRDVWNEQLEHHYIDCSIQERYGKVSYTVDPVFCISDRRRIMAAMHMFFELGENSVIPRFPTASRDNMYEGVAKDIAYVLTLATHFLFNADGSRVIF